MTPEINIICMFKIMPSGEPFVIIFGSSMLGSFCQFPFLVTLSVVSVFTESKIIVCDYLAGVYFDNRFESCLTKKSNVVGLNRMTHVILYIYEIYKHT